MPTFGLIGKSLGHSFSKSYFEKKFKTLGLSNHQYQNFELAKIDDLKNVLSENKDIKGFNVTIPYKESIISLLDDLDPEAKKIGAVNCIKMTNNKLIGFNTDVYGFSQS